MIATFEVPDSIAPYIVEKGFVAIDGISLTVTHRQDSKFSVALVAYTRDHVALANKELSQRVNIEADIVAKYVESLLASRLQSRSGVS